VTWKKGQSGNPNGRPRKGQSIPEQLEAAIKAVEKQRKIKMLNHFVRRALENDAVLIALMKKVLPDMKHVDSKVELPKEITIKWSDEPPPKKSPS
jgi:hypothetical protein